MTRLAIIGGGPSSTYALERLAAVLSSSDLPVRLEIHVFDSMSQFGAGQVHSATQPETSFLNRIVGQVSFAADETVEGAGPLLDKHLRPTLLEWCRSRFEQTGNPSYDLGAADWPKRFVHGEALQAQFALYQGILESTDGVEVYLHGEEVVDIAEVEDSLQIVTRQGTLVVDDVLLVTGHSSNDPMKYTVQSAWARFADGHDSRFVPSAYPLDQALPARDSVSGLTIGCRGMGLTTIDIILHLTEGRGGRFTKDAQGTVSYSASGDEPKSIVAFSRAGLFTLARPFNAKEANPQELEHHGIFLTEEAIDRVRDSASGAREHCGNEERTQLEFEEHVLPLVILEMALLYYTTLYGKEVGANLAAAAHGSYREFLTEGGFGAGLNVALIRLVGPLSDEADAIGLRVGDILNGRATLPSDGESVAHVASATSRYLQVVYGEYEGARLFSLLNQHADDAVEAIAVAESPSNLAKLPQEHAFTWTRMIEPLSSVQFGNGDDYRRVLVDFMRTDHLWAAQDNLWNPAKAAADGVWRDLRDVLAYAIDFGGLTAASHRQFLDVYMRHHNRLCNGAALEVMQKILALIECGIVDASAGPGAQVAGKEDLGKFEVTGPQTNVKRQLDVLIDARVHGFDAERDVLSLYPNLLKRGLVRKWRNPGFGAEDYEPGGLDLSSRFHPIRANGEEEPRLTILGPPSEGVMFFQLGALRPHKNHHVMRDVLAWLHGFWPSVVVDAPTGSESALV